MATLSSRSQPLLRGGGKVGVVIVDEDGFVGLDEPLPGLTYPVAFVARPPLSLVDEQTRLELPFAGSVLSVQFDWTRSTTLSVRKAEGAHLVLRDVHFDCLAADLLQLALEDLLRSGAQALTELPVCVRQQRDGYDVLDHPVHGLSFPASFECMAQEVGHMLRHGLRVRVVFSSGEVEIEGLFRRREVLECPVQDMC